MVAFSGIPKGVRLQWERSVHMEIPRAAGAAHLVLLSDQGAACEQHIEL